MTRSEFEQMAPQLRAEMLKVALDFLGNRNDAEDVAQDAMLQLWSYCKRIDGSRNGSGLAVRVAKSCCVSYYRKLRVKQRFSNMDGGRAMLRVADSSGSPQERMEAEDTRQLMTELMALLNPRERELFEMRRICGLSTREISEQTGIPTTSVSSMVTAARTKLFVELQKRLRR